MRVLLFSFLVVLLIQCKTPTDEVEETNSIELYCITGDCIVRLYTEENPDENWYHHIYRTFGGTFPPRFDLNIESSLMKDKYVYNNWNLVWVSDTYFGQIEIIPSNEQLPIKYNSKVRQQIIIKNIDEMNQ